MKFGSKNENTQIFALIRKMTMLIAIGMSLVFLLIGYNYYRQNSLLNHLRTNIVNDLTLSIRFITQSQALDQQLSTFKYFHDKDSLEMVKNSTIELDNTLRTFLKKSRSFQVNILLRNNFLVWEEIKRKIFRLKRDHDSKIINYIERDYSSFYNNMNILVNHAERELERNAAKLKQLNNDSIGMIIIVLAIMAGLYWILASNIIRQITGVLKEIEEKNIQFVGQSKLAAIGELAGGVAHEINNPLHIINNLSHTLKKKIEKDKIDKDQFIKDLEKVVTTTERISEIVKGLKRISFPAKEEEKAKIKVSSILENIVSIINEGFNSQGIEVRKSFQEEVEGLEVRFQEVQLGQVLMNIISNAKHEVMKHEERWIGLTLEKRESTICIEISNSGPIINPEIVNQIFNPYFTTKDIGAGTGLGLSLSKDIVEKNKGKLYLKPHTEHTTFVIEIPFNDFALEPDKAA